MALTEKLTAIADAIRGKTGKTDGLTLDQMATEIEGISGGEEVLRDAFGVPYTKEVTIGPYSYRECPRYLYKQAEKLEKLTVELSAASGWFDSGFGCNFAENCPNLTYFHAPKTCGWVNCNLVKNCANLKTIIMGGIGSPISGTNAGGAFEGCTNSELEITIYCTQTTLADAVAKYPNAPWGATNATIVYRNSTTGEVITE